MNSRLEALVNRGYPRDLVLRLASFTDEELEYASKMAFKHISRGCIKEENPSAIFIGGQPGCGKTVMSMKLKNEIKNAVEIGIDNYRMYHPNYLEIEKVIKDYWSDKTPSVNSTPGNDIADFTHYFAGAMTDKLIEMGKNNNYNLLLEWGMREPKGPLNCMKELKEQGYNNTVLFVCSNKDLSYEACNLRADIMKNTSRIIRKVPKDFHDYCIETLPDSVNEIYSEGTTNNLINYMGLITRENEVIWDLNSNKMPGEVYANYVNRNLSENEKNNLMVAFKTNYNEMVGLRKEISDLEKVKQEIISFNPHMFNMTDEFINIKNRM